MLFAWEIVITADTKESAPLKQTLKLSAGVITRMSIKFPSGCHGYVNAQLKHEENQILPTNRKGWITGDNEVVHNDDYYDLGKAAKEVVFLGHSEDSTYDHTVTVRINVLPAIAVSTIPILNLLTAIYNKLFGRLPE